MDRYWSRRNSIARYNIFPRAGIISPLVIHNYADSIYHRTENRITLKSQTDMDWIILIISRLVWNCFRLLSWKNKGNKGETVTLLDCRIYHQSHCQHVPSCHRHTDVANRHCLYCMDRYRGRGDSVARQHFLQRTDFSRPYIFYHDAYYLNNRTEDALIATV